MSLGIDGPIGAAVLDIFRRMDDLCARSLGGFEVFVDVIEIDEHAHRRSAGVEGRVHAALVGALSYHCELALKRDLPVHAAARRAHPHFLLKPKARVRKSSAAPMSR